MFDWVTVGWVTPLKHSETRSMSKTQKSFIEIRIWFVLSLMFHPHTNTDTENCRRTNERESLQCYLYSDFFGEAAFFRGDSWLELIMQRWNVGDEWKAIERICTPQIQFGKSLIYLIKHVLAGLVCPFLSIRSLHLSSLSLSLLSISALFNLSMNDKKIFVVVNVARSSGM